MKKRTLITILLITVTTCLKAQIRAIAPAADSSTRQPGANEQVQYYKKLSYRLAKLKMYPLALRYYYESILAGQGRGLTAPANTADSLTLLVDADTVNVDYLLSVAHHEKHKAKRIRVYFRQIKAKFDDGKQAIAYALLIHVKQPVPGTRSSYAFLNNVGHTFITLLKYNADKTTTANTFGFYPDKDHLLSATPVYPGSSAAFINDEEHEWDETVGCFISREKFDLIVRMVKRYSRRRYNLNRNNCSDFGLCVAGVAGIAIKDTKGFWPLGHGNTPASIGQSILEGRLTIADSTDVPFLFICNNTTDEN